jgi:hypothetical protein
MDLSALFIGLALLLWVIGAIWYGSRPTDTTDTTPPPDLAQQHAAILNALNDLTFEYQSGKLTATDYQQERAILIQQGAQVLKQLSEAKQ